MEKKSKAKSLFKKLLPFAGGLLVGGAFGYGIGHLIGVNFYLPQQYFMLPMWGNILIFAFTYCFSLIIHELAHFIYFKRGGIEMRALYIMVFLWIKIDGKWKLKFKPNLITLIGGIAIPDLPVVKGEEHFKQLQDTYAKAIIAGPIMSIALWVISLVILLPIMLIVTNDVLLSIITMFLLSLLTITLFYVVTSLFKSELAVGDFPAYRLCKKDPFFVAMQLYQYVLFSSDPIQRRKQNDYLKNVIYTGLEERFAEKSQHIYTLNILDSLVVEHLTGQLEKLPKVICDYVLYLAENCKSVLNKQSAEVKKILMFHIVYFLYQREDTKELADKCYKELLEIIGKDVVMTYYKKQSEHLLNIADHTCFLQNEKNIKTTSTYPIWNVFEGYYHDEKILNQMKGIESEG